MSETVQDPSEVAAESAGEAPPVEGAASADALPSTDDAQPSEDTASDEEASAEQDAPAGDNEALLVQEGDVAGDYLERLLDLLDYDGDIDLDVEGSRAIVSIDGGTDLEKLVGQRGQGLEALQELTRLAVQQETGVRSRLMLDIAGWRAARRAELSTLGQTTAETVLSSGEPERLRPMTPFERKIVHDAVAAVEGVHSSSEGEEPNRKVVVFRTE